MWAESAITSLALREKREAALSPGQGWLEPVSQPFPSHLLPMHAPGKVIAPFQGCHSVMPICASGPSLHCCQLSPGVQGQWSRCQFLGKTKGKFHRMWESLAQGMWWRGVCFGLPYSSGPGISGVRASQSPLALLCPSQSAPVPTWPQNAPAGRVGGLGRPSP